MDMTIFYLGRVTAALAISGLLPLGLGRLLFRSEGRDGGIAFLGGLFLELALFELIYLPFFFFDLPFSLLTAVFFIVSVPLSIGGFLLAGKTPARVKNKTALRRTEKISLAVFGAVLVYQVLRVTLGAGTWNIDDGWYLAIANSAIESDRILRFDVLTGYPLDYTQHIAENFEYVFSPWPLFWAMSARVTGLSITVLLRTVLPGAFIALFYYVVYRLLLFFFGGERDKTLCALAVLAVFYELTGIAMNVKQTWILCYPWMGKGFGPCVLCPAVLLFFLCEQEEKEPKRKRLLWLGIFLGNIAGCVTASSCAELDLIVLGCWGLSELIRQRDFSLVWKLGLCVSPSLLLTAGHILA